MEVYVLNKEGQPLMPTRPVIARLLLKEGKAKCIRRTPFTIKLLVDTTEYKQEVVAGMDTGSKTIGCAATANGKVVYQSEVQIRQDVSKKMEQRRMYRGNRRSRKTRYRKARWRNRASIRKKGRLAPSIKSKVDSHLREKKFVESILPVSRWKVEIASFDIHKISNPDVKRWDYQKGNQKGFYNVKAYVLHRDGYQCQKCKTRKGKLHVHHVVFRSNGGTDTPSNLITLCEGCHDKLHKGEFEIKGIRSKTKHATEVGIVKSQLEKQFGDFEETFGYDTKFKREQILQLPKSHHFDAIAICCEEGEIVELSDNIYFKKHVSKGDYQQTQGSRSEKRIPTGKLFGLRKFDYIQTPKVTGFIKGKRSTGFFAISDLEGKVINPSVNVKKDCIRLKARTTTLTERRRGHISPRGKPRGFLCLIFMTETKTKPKPRKKPEEVYTSANITSCPFEAWDNNGRYFQDYKYKLGIAEKLGYTYLSEAICKLYLLHEYSFNDIGELIGVKQSAIHYRLKRWGVYRRHAGGATHFTKTYQYRHLLWELAVGWKGTKKALYREAASQFQLNVNTVQAFYRQRRWEDFKE